MIEYVLFVPAPLDRKGRLAWLSMNERTHWAPRAEKTRQWRTITRFTAAQHKLPTGLESVHITAHVHKANNRSYDVHNLLPTMKAVVDGLVDYGLIDDDDNSRLTGPDMRHGDKRDQAGITITIKETT